MSEEERRGGGGRRKDEAKEKGKRGLRRDYKEREISAGENWKQKTKERLDISKNKLHENIITRNNSNRQQRLNHQQR